MAFVDVKGLVKRFGLDTVLDGVDLKPGASASGVAP
jgi:hypothetical protein